MSAGSIRLVVARALAMVTVAYGLLFYVVGATMKPGYSSISQYISELNATGTAHAYSMGLFGFVPLGLLFAAFLVAAQSHAQVSGTSRGGWWLLWSQPIAFLSVAMFPCDLGCPIGGSFNQGMHDLFGVTTYFAGALGLFLLSFAPSLQSGAAAARHVLRATGVLFILLFVLMLAPELSPVRGLLQRMADALLGLAVLVVGWRIVLPDGRAAAGP